jgi:hypothetical protein
MSLAFFASWFLLRRNALVERFLARGRGWLVFRDMEFFTARQAS